MTLLESFPAKLVYTCYFSYREVGFSRLWYREENLIKIKTFKLLQRQNEFKFNGIAIVFSKDIPKINSKGIAKLFIGRDDFFFQKFYTPEPIEGDDYLSKFLIGAPKDIFVISMRFFELYEDKKGKTKELRNTNYVFSDHIFYGQEIRTFYGILDVFYSGELI